MNAETFRIKRTIIGLDPEDVAQRMGINLRTVQRWDAGQNPIPDFAANWLESRWQAFISTVADCVINATPKAEVAGAPVEELEASVAVYRSRSSLARAGSTLTLREVNALNRAVMIAGALAGLDMVAKPVVDEKS